MTGKVLEDGIYFNLSEEDYHGLFALSASGIKNLLISPMDFWARSPLNPLKEERDSEALFVGKAYHKRILEGSKAFEDTYAVVFEPHPEIEWIETVADIQRELKALGQKTTGVKAELIERLIQANPRAPILDVARDIYNERHHGKQFLSRDLWNKIQFSAAMIEKDENVARCFQGGYSEVTVIWKDESSGVRMKARMDYLKPKAVTDLKTFSNMRELLIDQAIYNEIAARRYRIQGCFYPQAALKGAEFARAGKVFGDVDKDWLKAFSQTEEFGFYFVFQQKGIAPLTRGWKFERGTHWGRGNAEILDAIRFFKHYYAKFGTDPWIESVPIETLQDDRFPPWA